MTQALLDTKQYALFLNMLNWERERYTAVPTYGEIDQSGDQQTMVWYWPIRRIITYGMILVNSSANNLWYEY